MKLVPVQSQVYLSGEEPNTQVPLLAQGVLATHVSVRIHEHREEFNVYPGSQTVSQTIEGENCHYQGWGELLWYLYLSTLKYSFAVLEFNSMFRNVLVLTLK